MHAPLISTVRPGVIQVYQDRQVTQRLFVAGGFAEVTHSRCTVLAETAMPVDEIDRAQVEQQLKDAREDLADAKSDEERKAAERQVAVGEAALQAAGS
jgi:F-type H+-transporting ATPase subunit epsilon